MRSAIAPQERARIVKLYRAGRTADSLAAELGLGASTIRNWANAPVCAHCGSPLGANNATTCEPCRKAYERSDAYRDAVTDWPRDRIIAAIQWWNTEYGEPPAVPDWSATHCKDMGDYARAGRFERHHQEGLIPWFTAVVRAFGSWNNGIAAAGFKPRALHGGDGNQHRGRPSYYLPRFEYEDSAG